MTLTQQMFAKNIQLTHTRTYKRNVRTNERDTHNYRYVVVAKLPKTNAFATTTTIESPLKKEIENFLFTLRTDSHKYTIQFYS